MIVSNCPHCHEAFRVAAGELPEDAYAQCPWCHETFPVSDFLERLPPILAVFSSDGQPITPMQQVAAAGLAAGGFGAPAAMDLDVADDSETMWPDRSISNENIQFGADSSDAAASAMKVSSAARRSRSKGSPIRSVIGVVLGGVAAIPIAGGLLMALGKTPDWGFWPFNGEGTAAPSRSAAAPLPDRSTLPRTTTRLNGARGSGLTAGLDPSDSALQQITGDSLLEPEPVEDPSFPEPTLSEIEIDISDPSDVETESAEDPETSDQDRVPPIVMPSADGDPSSVAADAADASSPTGDVPDKSDPPSPTAEPGTATDQGDEQIVALLSEARQSIDALTIFEGTEKDRRRQLAQVYSKIATACEVSSSNSDGLRAMASQIANSPIIDDVAFAGAEWLKYSGRKTNGIALVGEPGGGDEPTLTLDSGKELSLIYAGELPQADRILALGRITADESAVEVMVAEPLP